MAGQLHKYITDFFDVSVLVPVNAYEIDVFRRNMDVNRKFLMRNGIEVVLVSSADAKVAMTLANEFPLINWKIILGDAVRVAAKLNAGLEYAQLRYLLVMEAGNVFETDLLYDLRYALYHYPRSFSVIPRFCAGADGRGDQVMGLEYRMLMAERKSIESIGGYNDLGNDRLSHVNIQRRLELAGHQRIVLVRAGRDIGGHDVSGYDTASALVLPAFGGPEVLFPRDVHAGGSRIESRACYDWTRQKSECAIDLVLGKFEKVTLKSGPIFFQEYEIIGLMQVHNEAAHIPAVLAHLDFVCDGIILLDDGSADGSYEKAISEKLLIKVKKAHDGIFDDLENRNLLLELAYLFRSAWFFFMDADERFDPRYADVRRVARLKDIDTVAFRLVHLWNMDSQYRRDLPEGVKGVVSRNRMFRNKGFLQVTAEREIHFCATPFKHNRLRSSILLLHYGLLNETDRIKKYESYLPQDAGGKKQGYPYEFLLDKEVELGNVDDIVLPGR